MPEILEINTVAKPKEMWAYLKLGSRWKCGASSYIVANMGAGVCNLINLKTGARGYNSNKPCEYVLGVGDCMKIPLDKRELLTEIKE